VISISTVVMTHPSRKRRAQALAQILGAAVVIDPDPSRPGAWSCARRSWSLPMRSRESHRLVLQDDAVPCEDFMRRAQEAISAQPEAMVAFYVGDRHAGANRLRAEARQCSEWHELERGHFVPTVALAMPRRMAVDLAHFQEAELMDWRYDDEIVGRFRDLTRAPAYATIPCLVEHDNTERSLLHPEHGWRGSCCPLASYTGRSPWAVTIEKESA
jgi:hypothetical protein